MKGARSTRPLLNRPSFDGFTLLELAIAASLSAILLAAVVVLTARGLSTWQAVDGRLQVLLRLEKGLSGLGEELRNASAPADLPFTGAGSEIAFATAEDESRLKHVRYRLETDSKGRSVWVRESSAFPEAAGQAPAVQTLAEGVNSFTLQYGAVAETDGQRTVRWVQSWDDLEQEPQAIPKVVRVRLEGTDARGRAFLVTRDLWVPSGVWVTVPNE